jgi:hypothetical protein
MIVRFMACQATLYDRFMDIGPGKLLFIMTGKARFTAGCFHEFRIVTVVRIMAGFTVPALHRLMDRQAGHLGLHPPVTTKTQVRRIFTHQEFSKNTMGQMAGCTIALFNRCMHDALLEPL